MCLLCVSAPHKTPPRDHLVNACEANPDGFGYALIIPQFEMIMRGHGMDATTIIDEYLSLREVYPDGWSLFHARWATHGVLNTDNCHPFLVGGDDRTVLGHNGILPIDTDGLRSDTRVFAEDFLPDFLGDLDDPDTFEDLEHLIGSSHNKIAILTLDPRLTSYAYILNEHLGHWLDGTWYSNDGYREVHYYPRWSTMEIASTAWDDDGCLLPAPERTVHRVCPMCGESASKTALRYSVCWGCGSCLVCGDDPRYCECDEPLPADDDDDLRRAVEVIAAKWGDDLLTDAS